MDHYPRQSISDRAYFIWKDTGRDDQLANWAQAELEYKTIKDVEVANLSYTEWRNADLSDGSDNDNYVSDGSDNDNYVSDGSDEVD